MWALTFHNEHVQIAFFAPYTTWIQKFFLAQGNVQVTYLVAIASQLLFPNTSVWGWDRGIPLLYNTMLIHNY